MRNPTCERRPVWHKIGTDSQNCVSSCEKECGPRRYAMKQDSPAPWSRRTGKCGTRGAVLIGIETVLLHDRLFQRTAEGIEVGRAVKSVDAFRALEKVDDGIGEGRGEDF